MATEGPPVLQWVQYLAARMAAAGLLSLGVEANLRGAATAGRLMHQLDKRHRQRANQHLRLAFPQLPDRQIKRLAVRSFEHFIQLFIEVCHTPRLIHADTWSSRVKLGDRIGPTLDLLNSQQPVIMVTGHLGNWEILGYLLATIGYRVNALARPLDNRLINDWLLGVRQRKGLRVITKWQATGQMLDVIHQGGLLGFIADQNAGDKGLFVPFFGRMASAYKSIGLLALTNDIPVICGYARRTSFDFRFEFGAVDIIYPQDWSDQPDPLYYITARYTRALETMVRECPQQYLWMHRRWKSRPRYEREDKPMPASLRRKLENLPWMDQSALDHLLQKPA